MFGEAAEKFATGMAESGMVGNTSTQIVALHQKNNPHE
jgi:hypothetical protein